MKSKYSSSWARSVQPRKQRKYRANAPLHVRRSLVSAHLSKAMRQRYGRRSMPLRKDDEIKVMNGEFRGTTGKITGIDLKRLKVFVDSVKKAKVSGQEVSVPMDPSNLSIMVVNDQDRKRMKFMKRSQEKDKVKK